MSATKFDAQKIRHDLLDDDAIEGLAKVLTFGAQKYAADNWRKGMEWRRLIGAARRHIAEFARGVNTDPESGLHHLDHAMCCLMFLSAYLKQGGGTDDRVRVTRALPTDPGTYRTPPPLIPLVELGRPRWHAGTKEQRCKAERPTTTTRPTAIIPCTVVSSWGTRCGMNIDEHDDGQPHSDGEYTW